MIGDLVPHATDCSIEQYYRRTLLPKLKDFKVTGLVAAQITTTKRTQVNLNQQYRRHLLVESILKDLQIKNHPCTLADIAACVVGGDEACFIACDGKVKVHGCTSTKKHQKKTADTRCSISILRVGNAAGSQGPTAILLKGQRKSKITEAFLTQHGAAPGSCVAVNSSAFMTSETWREIAPKIAAGIRAMPVIQDHPEWWVLFVVVAAVPVRTTRASLCCWCCCYSFYGRRCHRCLSLL